MDTKVLNDIGFNDNEIKVYLALLKKGPSTVFSLSRYTGVERTTVYRVLDSLMDKGAVNFISENKVKKYQAANPDKLLIMLNEKQEELKKIMPDLNNLSRLSRGNVTNVEIYNGVSGIKSMIYDILRLKEDYVTILADNEIDEMSLFYQLFMKSIEKNDLHERVLIKEGSNTYRSKNTTIRYLPKDYSYLSTIGVCGNLVGIVILTDPFFAVKIENADLAKTFKNYFELLWGISKV